MEEAETFKVMLVGVLGVGKSSFVRRFALNAAPEDQYDPTIDALYKKDMIVDKELVKLEILDLAGYHSEKGEGYDDAVRAAHGVVFVFAIDYHDSFKDLLKLKDRILQLKPDTPFGMIVCGHKSDIIRDKRIGTFVDVSEIKELSKAWKVPFFETSAVTTPNINNKVKPNIEEAMTALVREMRKAKRNEGRKKGSENCVVQ